MITTLTGPNGFMLRQALEKRLASFVGEHGDMAVERLDGEEVSAERLYEALTSLPFLSDKKLVLVRQGSANKRFAEKAPEWLAGVPETSDVLLVEAKLDKRSGYYKFLAKHTDFQQYGELDRPALSRWLADTARAGGGKLSLADANFLVDRLGQNQQSLSQELDKLLLYDPRIDRQAIEALTEPTPQSTIFELLEAAFNGRGRQALQLYDEQRALKVEPQQIIAMLSWQLHILALIKTAGQRSADETAAAAKLSPYVVRKSNAIANKLTLGAVKRLVADLLDIDARSKRQAYQTDDALKHYLLTLATF